MLPPNTRPMDDPLKYVQAKIPLANAYFCFGTLDCIIDRAIMNIESPTPWIILTVIRNAILVLKLAIAILAANIVMIILSTFFLAYTSESLPARGAMTAAV